MEGGEKYLLHKCSSSLADIAKEVAPANSIILFGDSITYNNGGINIGSDLADVGYFNWANVLLNQRFNLIRNAGIGGNTTAQMLARIQLDVIDYKPAWCLVMGGTNDLNAGTSALAIFTNLLAVYNALQNKGIRVIASTVPPSTYLSAGAITANYYELNRRIREYAYLNPNIILADMGASIADPTSNPPRTITGTTQEGVHPNSHGAAMMGQALYNVLSPIIPKVPIFGSSNYDTDVINQNSQMNGVAGAFGGTASGIVADTFNIYQATGTSVCSKVARTDDFIGGAWQQIVNTGASNLLVQTNVYLQNGVIAAGDKVIVQAEFESDADWANVAQFGLTLKVHDSGYVVLNTITALSNTGVAQGFNPRKGVIRTTPFTVPANGKYCSAILSMSGTSMGGTIRVGRFEIRKVYS